MASFVATGIAGDGQTVQVTQLQLTLPGSGISTGDRLHVFVNSSDPALAFGALPAGFTVIDGPRANGTSQGTAVLEKTLSASDAGSTFTIPWTSGSARVTLEWSIFTGVSGTTLVGVGQDAAATTSFVLPTVGSVPAGSVQIGMTLRRRSGASSVNTITGSPYTDFTAGTTNDVGTAYASGVNVFGSGGYVTSSAAGTVGGETWTSGGTSSLGTSYVIVVPTGPVTGSGTLARTGSGTLSLSGSAAGALARTGSGALIFTGKPVGVGALARTGGGALTLNSAAGAGALAVAGSGALALSGKPSVSGALGRTGSGALSLSGKPGALAGLTRTGSGALTMTGRAIRRFSWWNGSIWVPITPQIWDGQAWRSDVPVTVTAANT
jgi:hypothetical protein